MSDITVIKSQKPLYDEKTAQYFYPKTTIDQVIVEDGTRLSLNNFLKENIAYLDDKEEGVEAVAKIDADTLGGQLPSYYAPAENGVFVYTHTAGALSGSGINGRFKATVNETVSVLDVNGTSCVVKCGEETEMELVADCWYTFILDGNTINFKQGGAGLNFRIVGGTTQPSSPKENTVWIETDVAIGEWQFSAKEPTTRADGTALQSGDVWIYTSTASNVTMNIIKKNNIEIYPLSASQYINGVWVGKTAKSYINGVWQDWYGWLYSQGKEYIEATGGWLISGNCSKGSTAITVGSTSATTHQSNAITAKAVDFTGLKTLIIHFTRIYANTTVGIMAVDILDSSGNAAISTALPCSYNEGSYSDYTKTIDISELSGEYKIRIRTTYTHNSNTRIVYAIFDEVRLL